MFLDESVKLSPGLPDKKTDDIWSGFSFSKLIFYIFQMKLYILFKSKRIPEKIQNTFLEGQQQSVNNNVDHEILMVMNPNFEEKPTNL